MMEECFYKCEAPGTLSSSCLIKPRVRQAGGRVAGGRRGCYTGSSSIPTPAGLLTKNFSQCQLNSHFPALMFEKPFGNKSSFHSEYHFPPIFPSLKQSEKEK
ncbi:rCG63672 [Rattus norvegicus]|uniref:RCG63672 n=1 Tax=Rattus norvegicus TaxID=10116 RepID=A6JVI3_RAT|nr:rCG63672 [Rattus norvegicus]